MINNLYGFDSVINEIENNLTSDININSLAKSVNMSVYEFRRIFSFLIGMPVNEYIRKRRLSVAAEELVSGRWNITDAAINCGYDSQSAFARAFKAFHGISPTEAKDGKPVKMVTRIGFNLVTTGGSDISYKIINDSEFSIYGFCGDSDISDTECCENVWDSFYKSEIPEKTGNNELYTVYKNGEDTVKCYIGVRGIEIDGADRIHIPASAWASFKLRTTDDEMVNRFYKDVLFQWLSSGKYEKNNDIPNIEVFPADMDEDDFEWEIRIPLKGEN